MEWVDAEPDEEALLAEEFAAIDARFQAGSSLASSRSTRGDLNDRPKGILSSTTRIGTSMPGSPNGAPELTKPSTFRPCSRQRFSGTPGKSSGAAASALARLALAQERMLRRLKGRRARSRPPRLIDYVLSRPIVSSAMI
ncbi:hypothetical protein GCM10007937_42990 [Mesorhizobium albiziae]|nr:hypothetical protein GCM10007937_42990 [Mesorhizobium albiziae]